MRISDWSSDVCSSDLLPPLLARLLPGLDGHGALVDELTRALIETPPVDAAQGGYVAKGYDAALDALRETARDGRKAIAALEAQYRERTGIAPLKIRHNGVLGYHVEVPAKHADALRSEEPTSELQSLMRISYAVFCL